MTYKIAGIDVHKHMLAVVVADAAAEGEWRFERRKFGTVGSQLEMLAQWLASEQVREAVMESTAQYWKPVWRQLEGQCQLHLADYSPTLRGAVSNFRRCPTFGAMGITDFVTAARARRGMLSCRKEPIGR